MVKSSMILAAVLVGVGTAGVGIWSRKDTTVPVLNYVTATVERGELITKISATGSINPLVTVQVGSQVSGRIERILVDFNSKVRKGEVVAQLDSSLLTTQVTQAQSSAKSAEAALEKARVKVRETQRQVERLRDLDARKLLSASELETAQFAHEAAVADEHLQEANLDQARAALAQVRVSLAHTTIYAPIDGVVISRSVDVGQTVAASLQAPTLFTIANDLSRMQIETQVDEAFIGQIHQGQPVTFTVFAYPGRSFQGTVAQIRLNPTVESGVVKYNCIIRVDNTDLVLKPGMTATVTVETNRLRDVFTVPNAAVRFVPAWPPEKLAELRKRVKRQEGIIWLKNGSQLDPVVVHIGAVGDTQTEISADGLQEKAEVVVSLQGESGRGEARPRGFRLF
jgi:HlyD family secretion protein